MIDITTSISPIDGEYPNIKKWAGSISLKGGEDGGILHYPIKGESPKHIVKTQICALKSMKVAIEKRIRLLESSLRD